MAFEWDEEKRKANLVKHGVNFRQMPELFDGPTVEAVDGRVCKLQVPRCSTQEARPDYGIATLNLVMLLSIAPIGSHYLVDRIAGGALGLEQSSSSEAWLVQ